MSESATDLALKLHERFGDFFAEISVDEESLPRIGHNFNVALYKETDESIGVLSYNGATLEDALRRAVDDLVSPLPDTETKA